jgi:hypothetical protein
MHIRISSRLRLFSATLLVLACFSQVLIFVEAQTETTGAFRGRVVDEAGAGLPDATVRATNKLTGVPTATRTTPDGYFTIGLLQPGDYTLTVLKGDSYDVRTRDQRLTAVDATTVLPEPFVLKRRTGGTIAAQPTPVPTGTQQPVTQATPVVIAQTTPTPEDDGDDIAIDINKRNARRGGVFTREEVSTLPLGATTLTRSFDELALLLPGVASPPQTVGNVAGPGVGPGVGSAGQFAVNGMRSRSNNFTVDGSDNNDEDIGVRRQGFLALVPQPVESIQEYQVTTLLAPAQYGRNLGAQVNAVSKSGGNELHGTIFGFLNTSQLNARNTFDDVGGNVTRALTAGNLNVIVAPNAFFDNAAFRFLPINGSQINVSNTSGNEDSFTLGQGGMVLGGKLIPDKLFFFISAEGQALNATKEVSFAVPTVQQRGAFGSGATGIFRDPFAGTPTPAFAFPTEFNADAIFSLFPFPNNPNGVYGRNTFTQTLPASGQGKIVSGKVDGNWDWRGRPQSFTARYNFTDDWRDIPVTGEAIFSTLRPRVRTQNFSTFLNSQLRGADSARPIFNQLRASYGRTRLIFDAYTDPTYQIRSGLLPGDPFLLNARVLSNFTLPSLNAAGVPVANTTNPVLYVRDGTTTEDLLGPVGQVRIAGLSPIGVDVFNFPQRRVNNTYQIADTMTMRIGNHNLAFGTDIRRTELNSDLPRLSRPLITFNGAPQLVFNPGVGFQFGNRLFINPLDLAASSAASGFVQTLSTTGSSAINLRYYQYNFFGQDEWRITPNLSLSYGLRYEYNTPPEERSGRIESTFNSPLIAQLVPGLGQFIDGRTSIFDADKNNFAPRVGLAYSPNLFGNNRSTVIRAGYGIFYDQILGAVVSQSRNVFPSNVTINLAGGFGSGIGAFDFPFGLFPPSIFAQTGTLNRLDPSITVTNLLTTLRNLGLGINAVAVTLPDRNLQTPMAHQYSVSFEQQLSRGLVLSAAYVGTQGRNLLRLTTPNLGSNAILLPLATTTSPFGGLNVQPGFLGVVLAPGTNITPGGGITGGRPTPGAGPVEIYTSDARSRYDALQLQLRGRYGFLGSNTQIQVGYTFSKVKDDVSDVFDLGGAPALPQNSRTFEGEYAPANFDVRHRITYNYITDLSNWGRRNAFFHFLFDGAQIAGTGVFQTGQPFTVNSIFDVNLDGNLTDRPNTLAGIQETNDRARPYTLTADALTLLAPIGQSGAVPRNAFRSSNLWLTNTAIIKTFKLSEDKGISFRMDIFNLFNRANYGIPGRFLETPWFGRATDTVTPGRRIQFAVKYSF